MKDLIEFIEIQGFQSQYNTRIDLSEGMTAFTGLSMDGKTAILRAFEFVRKNRPSGFKFNYRYEDVITSVCIGVNGHKITHKKANKALNKEGHKALYIIEYPNGDIKEKSAYGTNVPEEVTNILNVSDIAIQSQLDPYMLVLSTAGQIANTINKITGIDASDKWIKDINKAKNGLKAEKTVLENSNSGLASDIARYTGIDEVKEKISKAQGLDWEYDKIIRDANAILDLVNGNSAANLKITAINGHLNGLRTLLNRLANINGKMAGINDGMALKDEYNISWSEVNVTNGRLGFLTPRLLLLTSLSGKETEIKNYIEFKNFYGNQTLMKEVCEEELEVEKDKLTELLIQAGSCYVCGSELTDRNKIRSSL